MVLWTFIDNGFFAIIGVQSTAVRVELQDNENRIISDALSENDFIKVQLRNKETK
jgi:hypothetical protein